ncbi:MAG: bacterial Ig-like domain-containing protein [Treponema sp.]|nr:bacterial Ig-like domain-containing protein [Treponema sp.]
MKKVSNWKHKSLLALVTACVLCAGGVITGCGGSDDDETSQTTAAQEDSQSNADSSDSTPQDTTPEDSDPENTTPEVTQTAIPYSVSGTISKDTALPALAVSSTTGASVSFWLDLATAVTDNTYEWESPLKISDGTNTIWIDVGPLGIWLEAGGANLFEGSATRGSSFTADNWTLFCQDGNAQYVTINFDTDGNITYYKNGLAALTYSASTVVTGDITVATGCAKAIEILGTDGALLSATLDDSEYAVYDAYVTKALTADEAKAQFLSSFSKIEITVPEDVSFVKGASFSSNGVSVSGTDSQNVVFDLTSYASVDSSAVNMDEPGTYTVTVTCASESKDYSVEVKNLTVTGLSLTTTNVQTQYYTDGSHVPVLSTENLVITATFDDESTDTIAVSDAEISALTVTTGTQTVTVSYNGKSAAYDVTVSALTEETASWSGDITGGSWWTVFAGSSNTDGIKVVSGKKLTTTMTITAIHTGTTASNWEIAPDVLLFATNDYSEYAVLRADNYGWGTSYDSATLSSDWDWSAFQSYILDSTLTITVANYGDGIVDVKYDFTKTVDDTTTTHYQYYTGIPVTADNVYANLVFENCNVTFASQE